MFLDEGEAALLSAKQAVVMDQLSDGFQHPECKQFEQGCHWVYACLFAV